MNPPRKPRVKLVGTDGNVFALLGRCVQALRRAGQHEEAEALKKAVMSAHSYGEALALMTEAVDVY